MNTLPTYAAPADGKLTAEMLADFREAGVLILEGFVSPERCEELRQHTLDLIREFDPAEIKHVFSAKSDVGHGDAQLGDSYFEESGDKVRFFFEQNAFNEQGELQQPKENSLNKIGHALHDLDPVFDEFSRTPELAAAVGSLGSSRHALAVRCTVTRIRPIFTPTPNPASASGLRWKTQPPRTAACISYPASIANR
jgi:phytanoyl-CoA hydroxylase